MKYSLVLLYSLFSLNVFAQSDCEQGAKDFVAVKAPRTKEIKIVGQYLKKASDGTFKSCELSVKIEHASVRLNFDHNNFNPSYGDGGAFWPFGSYPLVEVPSDEYRSLMSYQCQADYKTGLAMDYTFREKNGWRKKKRYSFSVLANDVGTYDATLRDGDPELKAITCRGTIVEK